MLPGCEERRPGRKVCRDRQPQRARPRGARPQGRLPRGPMPKGPSSRAATRRHVGGTIPAPQRPRLRRPADPMRRASGCKSTRGKAPLGARATGTRCHFGLGAGVAPFGRSQASPRSVVRETVYSGRHPGCGQAPVGPAAMPAPFLFQAPHQILPSRGIMIAWI